MRIIPAPRDLAGERFLEHGGTGPGVRYGNVGIASTTPWRKLSVTGTVGFDGLTAGAGAGSLCLTANKEVVYSDNAGCTGSSLRFKHDIVSLDAASGIEEAMKLRPVSFVYNDDIGVKGPQVGFIAEDVAQVDQRLVTYDASATPNNVKYQNMVAIAIKAIQDIWNTIAGFADHFTTKELTFTRATGDEIDVPPIFNQKNFKPKKRDRKKKKKKHLPNRGKPNKLTRPPPPPPPPTPHPPHPPPPKTNPTPHPKPNPPPPQQKKPTTKPPPPKKKKNPPPPNQPTPIARSPIRKSCDPCPRSSPLF